MERNVVKHRKRGGGHKLFFYLWLILGYSIVSTIFLSDLHSAVQNQSDASRVSPAPEVNGASLSGDDDEWWLGKIESSGGLLKHPYMGARHPNGSVGMLVNPSPSRLQVIDITKVSNAICSSASNNTDYGIEGKGGKQVLDKARTGQETQVREPINSGEGGERASRILCLVYSVHLPPDGKNDHIANHANLRAVAQTWGQKCDGFIGASNLTDHSIGAVNLMHMGPEEYGNMWQKVRSMWAMAMNYMSDYDFFHIMGDDGYVFVDNLRSYLDSDEVIRLENGYLDLVSSEPDFVDSAKKWASVRPRPLFLGLPVYRRQRSKYPNGTFDGTMVKTTYPAGGSGYTLNRAALQLLQRGVLDEMFTDFLDSREDVLLGRMFSSLGVYVSVTIDQHHGGRYLGSSENAYHMKSDSKGPHEPKRMRKKFKMWHADGLEGVSQTAISFHLKDDNPWLKSTNNTLANLMLRYHSILYNLCPE